MNRVKKVGSRRAIAPALVFTVLSVGFASGVYAQDSNRQLNEYYRFPFSVGAGYRDLKSLSGLGMGYSVREFGAELRMPLSFAPILQPFVRGGTASWLEAGSAGNGQFDHDESWAAVGLSFSSRFSRNFELGIEAAGGMNQTAFPNLSAGSVVGSAGVIAEAGGRIGFVPFYNMSVDLRPGFRWTRSLGPLDEFDGFSFGLGFAVSWRFGQDPDAPAAAIRALRIESGKLSPVYAAMQSYYASNPFSIISLHNEESSELRDIEVSFFQPAYMDAPTPVATIATVAPRGSVQVGIVAAFNQEVFRTEGTTPLAGELVVKYRSRGRPAEQRFPVSYELFDRTAITWDDDRKVGAFITPADSALRNYASYVRSSLKSEVLPQLNDPLQASAQLYSALARLGIIYQADPSSPFVRAQAGSIAVDSVNIARATLTRGTGDCDDLTVLFASLLESIGVDTGFITVPGHIYLAVNTKLAARDYRDIHPDRGMTIVVDDQLWLPVEITLVGKQGFIDAWRRGSELWKLYDSDPAKRGFYKTAEAQQLYRPVALRESDLGLQYGSKEELSSAYRIELVRLGDATLGELASFTAKSGGKRDWNALGIAYARFGRLKDAEAAFNRALRLDPAFTSPQVNLGNLLYMQKEYRKALSVWQAASKTLEKQGKGDSTIAQMILVNVSLTYNALSDFASARSTFEKAATINPERLRDFAYLAGVGAGSSTASSASSGRASEQKETVMFLADE